MRRDLPEHRRIRSVSSPSDGANGAFLVPSCVGPHRLLVMLISDGRDWAVAGLPGEPWEHVSVRVVEGKRGRVPTWAEMCQARDLFFEPTECVMQLHPPHANYLNIHPDVLHLWRPTQSAIPRPPQDCV
jgi:hypothetical protein